MIVVALYSYHRRWQEGASVASLAKAAIDAGADAVELLDVQFGLRGLPLPLAEAKARESRESLEETPVAGYAATPVFGGPSAFADVVARLRLAHAEAVHYRARSLRVFSADPAPGVSPDAAKAEVIDGLRMFVAEAQLPIGLENHGSLFASPKDVHEILCAVPGLMTTLDVGNYRTAGHDCHEAVELFAGRIANVHLKEFRQGLPVCLGDGEPTVNDVLDQLLNSGYRGPLTIELEMPENPEAAVEKSVEWLRKRLPDVVP